MLALFFVKIQYSKRRKKKGGGQDKCAKDQSAVEGSQAIAKPIKDSAQICFATIPIFEFRLQIC